MKVTVSGQEVQSSLYPSIKHSEFSSNIALFISPELAYYLVVRNGDYRLGDQVDINALHCFTDFDGTLTISNE